MSARNRIPEEIAQDALAAIQELSSQSQSAWVSWTRVAIHNRGTPEEMELYRAVARMPEFKPLFVQDKAENQVKLSMAGMARALAHHPEGPTTWLSTESVARAIRVYASKRLRGQGQRARERRAAGSDRRKGTSAARIANQR